MERTTFIHYGGRVLLVFVLTAAIVSFSSGNESGGILLAIIASWCLCLVFMGDTLKGWKGSLDGWAQSREHARDALDGWRRALDSIQAAQPTRRVDVSGPGGVSTAIEILQAGNNEQITEIVWPGGRVIFTPLEK